VNLSLHIEKSRLRRRPDRCGESPEIADQRIEVRGPHLDPFRRFEEHREAIAASGQEVVDGDGVDLVVPELGA
jgi:hypothetical protein